MFVYILTMNICLCYNIEKQTKIKEKELEIPPNTPDGKVVAVTEKFENDYYRFPIYVDDDYKEAHKIRNNLYRIILEKENIHLDKAMKILNDYKYLQRDIKITMHLAIQK